MSFLEIFCGIKGGKKKSIFKGMRLIDGSRIFFFERFIKKFEYINIKKYISIYEILQFSFMSFQMYNQHQIIRKSNVETKDK